MKPHNGGHIGDNINPGVLSFVERSSSQNAKGNPVILDLENRPLWSTIGSFTV